VRFFKKRQELFLNGDWVRVKKKYRTYYPSLCELELEVVKYSLGGVKLKCNTLVYIIDHNHIEKIVPEVHLSLTNESERNYDSNN